MSLDKVTEMVSHMIGIFHTTLEEERMRDVYEKFKALAAQDPELEAPGTVEIQFKAKHSLEGFSPDIDYEGNPFDAGTTPIGPPFIHNIYFAYSGFPPFTASKAQAVSEVAQDAAPVRMKLTIEPASSVVVVTYQTAYLSDNDVLLTGDSDMAFVDPAIYLAELQQYALIASAIRSPVDVDRLTPGETATEDAIAIWEHIGSVQASTFTGVTSTALHGAAATGLHLNGELVDELPILDDIMPSFMADEDAEEEAEPADEGLSATPSGAPQDGEASVETEGLGNANDGAEDHEFPDPFEGLGGGYSDGSQPDIDDGHAVVAGANALVNQISITTAWLDAPVISVAGDVVNLDVISQVNLLVDHDSGSLGEVFGSVTMNSANMTFTSTQPTSEASAEDEEDASDLGLPSNWAVTQIEGDLICVNQVSQYTFQTDNDIADISFSSTNTYIGLGDNTVINLTTLSELGYGYDLIMIGGSLISVNWISQCNVLIDNDTLSYTGLAPTALDGGDNLLFNGAEISEVGTNAYVDMQSNFSDAIDSLAAGDTDIDASVAQDSLFEGIDILTVLYIDGDFTTINWLEQTNILGDSDQVNLMMDEVLANTDGDVTVTAGSNALINVASITEFGVDSTVMAGGEVYDDALLYTADFIDTEAEPLGVSMPALATEAVAFLADDMINGDAGPADAPIMATAPESTASPDVMQTMLA